MVLKQLFTTQHVGAIWLCRLPPRLFTAADWSTDNDIQHCCWWFYRKKRAALDTDSEDGEDLLPEDAIEPADPTVIPGPEGLHPNDTWPTTSGITQQMATSSCDTPIRALPIFATCDEYTLESRQPIIQSCVLDIQVGLQDFHMLKLKLKTNLYSAIKSEDSEALDGGTSQLSSPREYGKIKNVLRRLLKRLLHLK